MRVSRIRFVTRALALLVVSSLLTTCGGDSSSSKDDRGVFGEMADALKEAESEYLERLIGIVYSVQQVTPTIAASLNVWDSSRDSCLPAEISGMSFSYDGVAFVPSEDINVPDTCVRFILYRSDSSGLLMPVESIGYLEVSCSNFGDQTVDVFLDGDSLPIFTLLFLQPDLANTEQIAATAWDSDHAGWLSIHLWRHENGFELNFFQFTVPGPYWGVLSASYGVSSDSTGQSIGFAMTGVPWLSGATFGGLIAVDSGGKVLDGSATLNDDSPLKYIACIQSGSSGMPVFSVSSTQCHHEPIGSNVATASQLEAMSQVYQTLRRFWLAAARIMSASSEIVP